MLEHLSLEGLTSYVHKRWGETAATATGDLIVVAIVVSAIGAIVGAGAGIFFAARYLITFLTAALPATFRLPVELRDILVLLLSTLATAIAVTILLKRIKTVDRQHEVIEAYIIEGLDPRLKSVTVSVEELARRITLLERHVDINGSKKRLQKVIMNGLEAASPLAIHEARYGLEPTPQKSVDVVDALRKHIHNEQVDILVTNETLGCGNPFAGERKTLFVEYSGGGHNHSRVAVGETHKLVIPEPMTLGRIAGLKR